MSDDLVSRATIKAQMLRMGEPVAFGIDADMIDELAQALTEARAEIKRQADTIRLLDERCAQYERRAEQAGRALEVLAPVRDMLILCGELGGMQPGEKMADYLRRLIDEVAGVESLRARVREVVGPFADAAADLDDADRDATDIWEAPCAMQINVGHLRAARQLNEDLKNA